jgi:hypothetical protein
MKVPDASAAPNAHAANMAAAAKAAAAGNTSAVVKAAIRESLRNMAFLLERESV